MKSMVSDKLCIYCVYRIQYITQPCQLHSTLLFMAHTGYLSVHSFIIPSVRISLVFSLHPSFPQTCASVSGLGICWAFCLPTNSSVFMAFFLFFFFSNASLTLCSSQPVCVCASHVIYLCSVATISPCTTASAPWSRVFDDYSYVSLHILHVE